MDVTEAPPIELDVTAIGCEDWPERPLTKYLGVREKCFQVVFRQSVLDEIHLHGQTDTDIEICGVLIGTGYRDEKGAYMLVDHCIRGNGATNKATNVTFTADTWAHIQNTMDRDFPDQKMVGWYHTHPGFGIFLSEMDLFICNNFFNLPWQMAFVYDPIGGDEGNFVWRHGRPERDVVLIEDDVTPRAAKIPLISVADAVAGSDLRGSDLTSRDLTGSELNELVEAKILELLIRVRRLEKRQKLLVFAMAFMVTFMIVWELVFSPAAALTPVSRPATQPMINRLDHTPPPPDLGETKSELH